MNARLLLESGECSPSSLDLTPLQTATIGRSRDNAIFIPNDLVSRLHAKIYFDSGKWVLRDFGLNGTRIDGNRITGATNLADGVQIQLGDVQLRFHIGGSTAQNVTSNVTYQTPPPAMSVFPNVSSMQRSGRMSPDIIGTKIHDYPIREIIEPIIDQSLTDTHLKVDELTTLCRFMTDAVAVQDPQELIAQTLRTILNQTSATLAGYLSLDPSDPMPKVVLPEKAAVDMRLSRRLTERVRTSRRKFWLFSDNTANSGDSLQSLTDAVCIPLSNSLGEPFAALHVYRIGRGFTDREVRFLEVSAAFLAPTLETHRNRRKLQAENSRLRNSATVADELIGDSSAIMNLRMQISRAASQSLTVLIHGESGSGKELVAHALHQNGNRANGPLVFVNCASIAPSLLEAEFFGYRKGAFPGADRDHMGLFEQADEGTLVLDEVAELSLECQAKLLRVIEGKAFRAVGGLRDIKVDVRLVASTHRDLEAEVRAGRFRQDLYFRLKVIHLHVPPLREHSEDIPELARFFLERLATQCRRPFKLSSAAIRKLQSYNWPGNVRQLRAILESAAVMSETENIDAEDLPVGTNEPTTPAPAPDLPPSLDMDELETWAIRKALIQTGGNVSQAAKLLGISRDTLHTKLKKKNIDRETILHEAQGS
ncbi:MAG: sigma 54-interacting transcriptional regulator [Fimbriiglobus sp.]